MEINQCSDQDVKAAPIPEQFRSYNLTPSSMQSISSVLRGGQREGESMSSNDISKQLSVLEEMYGQNSDEGQQGTYMKGEKRAQNGVSFSLFEYLDMVIDGREKLKVDFAIDEGFEQELLTALS